MGSGRGDTVRPMLEEALRCWDVVEPHDQFLAKGPPGRIWRGMRGVTRLILARQEEEPLVLLRGARTDLRLAEERGDTSEEHFAFCLEVLLRLSHDTAGQATVWAEADELVERAGRRFDSSFTWLSTLGELHVRKAQSLNREGTADGDPPSDPAPGADLPETVGTSPQERAEEAMVARRTAALEGYQQALVVFERASAHATGNEYISRQVMLRHHRGVARAGVARSLQGLRTTQDVRRHYAEAVEDLRWAAGHDRPVRGSAYPSALIDYALHLYREKEFEEAHDRAEEAYLHCRDAPDLLKDPAKERFLAELRQACRLRRLWPTAVPDGEGEQAPAEGDPGGAGGEPRLDQVRGELDALLELEPAESPSVVPLVLAPWFLIEQGALPEDLARIRAAVEALRILREQIAQPERRSWISARLGMLCGQLDRMRRVGDPGAYDLPARRELSGEGYEFFRSAVEESPGRLRNVEFGLGRAALHFAKVLLGGEGQNEEAVMLLYEARTVLERCIDEDPDADDAVEPLVGADGAITAVGRPVLAEKAASYLGETCLRLHALTRHEEHVREAIRWFEKVPTDEGTVSNAHGMLGDAYLRLARGGGAANLRTGLELKARARAGGDRSRENFSVSASGHHRLWRMTGAREEFATAVDLALRARRLDTDWPWPLMQLADFAGAPAADRALLPASRPTVEGTAQIEADAEAADTGVADTGEADAEAGELLQAVRRGDQGGLYRRAARTAVHALPFRQAVLGGRSDTFVLDDPHRLLSTTLVLKPTSRTEAEAEQTRLASLARYLHRTNAPRWMLLPEVLALVDLPPDWRSSRNPPPDTALASRRSVGRSLAAEIADAHEGRRPAPKEMVSRALRYLARIHVWSSGFATREPGLTYEAAAQGLMKRAGRLGMPDPEGLAAQWTAGTPCLLPGLPGRDAHAENWLVTDSGAVVALDLEPHAYFPLLYEVAQLIEDHAVLDIAESEWSEREELCALYLDELASLGHPDSVDAGDVLPAYQSFALVRAVFLAEHLSGSSPRPSAGSESTGSRRHAERRLAHARAMIESCARSASDVNLRAVAARLGDLLDAGPDTHYSGGSVR